MEIILYMDQSLTNKIRILIMGLLLGEATIQIKRQLKIKQLKKLSQKLISKKDFKQLSL